MALIQSKVMTAMTVTSNRIITVHFRTQFENIIRLLQQIVDITFRFLVIISHVGKFDDFLYYK